MYRKKLKRKLKQNNVRDEWWSGKKKDHMTKVKEDQTDGSLDRGNDLNM